MLVVNAFLTSAMYFCTDINPPCVGGSCNTTDMSSYFANAHTLTSIGLIDSWDTSCIINMSNMFYSSVFDQPIREWNTSQVTSLAGMFQNAHNFNQSIGSWDTGRVTDMSNMFNNASYFDQDLGDWDVRNVTNMSYMFYRVTLSTDNYDSLLLGWSNQTVKGNVTFHGGNSKYSSAGLVGRNILINDYDWKITDGSLEESTPGESDLDTGIVASYDMGGSGDLVDSLCRYDLSEIGDMPTETGFDGEARGPYNDTADYFENIGSWPIINIRNGLTSFVRMKWISEDNPGRQMIASFGLGVNDSSAMTLFYDNGSMRVEILKAGCVNINASLPIERETENWWDVFGIWNTTSNKMRVIVNGVSSEEIEQNCADADSLPNMYVGTTGAWWISGLGPEVMIDEMTFWNRTLSDSEMDQIHDEGLSYPYAAGDSAVELDYWRENDTAVWVKIPTLSANTPFIIQMANNAECNSHDGSEVFGLFFDSCSDFSSWTAMGNTSCSGNIIHANGTPTNYSPLGYRYAEQFNNSIIFELSTNTTAVSEYGNWTAFGFLNTATSNASVNNTFQMWCYGVRSDDFDLNPNCYINGNMIAQGNGYAISDPVATRQRIYIYNTTSAKVEYRYNNSVFNHTETLNGAPLYPTVGVWENIHSPFNFGFIRKMYPTGMTVDCDDNACTIISPVDTTDMQVLLDTDLAGELTITGETGTLDEDNDSDNGGGSGGGGGGLPPPPGNSDQEITIWTHVPGNQPQIVEIKNDEIGITEIEFTLTTPTATASVTVQLLPDAPKMVKGEVDGIVYKYMSIKKSGIDDDNVKDKIVLKFRVDTKWLKENGLDPQSVSLKRNVDGVWTTLVTRSVDSDDEYFNYEADTPGFSYFAISAEKKKEALPEAVQESGAENPASGIKEEPAPEPVAKELQEPTDISDNGSSSSWAWMVSLFVIIWAGLMLIVLKKKHKASSKTEGALQQPLQKEPRPSQQSPTRGDDSLKSLEQYVKSCRGKNASDDMIRKALEGKGWPSDIVEKLLRDRK
ncbi:MAG: BspA family leucine-rich repeat surface protein [archaeon]